MVWITIHMLFHSELMHKLGIVQSLTLSITKFCTYIYGVPFTRFSVFYCREFVIL